MFALPSTIAAPADVPAEFSTGLVLPVITELIVSVLAPLVINNSLCPEVNRPRAPMAPIARALLSDPESNPPLASVNVSALAPKFTCAVLPFNVSELIVCPPVKTGNAPLNLTLLVALAPANDTTCSNQLI